MKKLPISLLLLFIYVTVLLGQKAKEKGPSFDVVDFNKKAEIAQWLVEYDTVAWKTTDVVMTQDKTETSRLGKEWFCFQDKKGVWHAVYGKFENNKFDLVFHFVMDASEKVTRSSEKIDETFLRDFATALQTANQKLSETIPAGSPRHNQYIRRNTDNTFTVWLLPAFQSNGMAVYGGEFIYTLDQAGEKITKDESYFQGQFKGFKTGNPREIWLNYREIEKPTLGTIFFVWYYKQYFTKIFIDNAKSTSTAISTDSKTYTWLHIEKDEKPAEKK